MTWTYARLKTCLRRLPFFCFIIINAGECIYGSTSFIIWRASLLDQDDLLLAGCFCAGWVVWNYHILGRSGWPAYSQFHVYLFFLMPMLSVTREMEYVMMILSCTIDKICTVREQFDAFEKFPWILIPSDNIRCSLDDMAKFRSGDLDVHGPSAAYEQAIVRGLIENTDLSKEQAKDYIVGARCPNPTPGI
jgi:hypothetical protein